MTCLSNDPWCARGGAPSGSYEAYIGALCGACEDEQIDRDRINRCESTCDEDVCGCTAEPVACTHRHREDARLREAGL